jgi:hypothetical protein
MQYRTIWLFNPSMPVDGAAGRTFSSKNAGGGTLAIYASDESRLRIVGSIYLWLHGDAQRMREPHTEICKNGFTIPFKRLPDEPIVRFW